VLRIAQRSPRSQSQEFSLRTLRDLVSVFLAAVLVPAAAIAHDLERTRVSLTFSADGSFVADVSNDPRWLQLRLESIRGPFIDRVVLFVDGREIRPTSVEYLPPPVSVKALDTSVATYRMRGKMPLDARTLRWYYGLVIDPYPLTIRRADRRVVVEQVAGGAWSRDIDLSGQFSRQTYWPVAVVAGLLAAGVIMRARSVLSRTDGRRNELL
jgi:hypothetical protein